MKFNPSFWEQEFILGKSDYLIVGAGFTGLFSAIALKRKFPNKRVIVIDRGSLPIGASTRNAGFACFGSPTEILSDIKEMGADKTFSLVEKRWRGLQNLLQICPPDIINYEPVGGNEVFLQNDEEELRKVLDKLDYLNEQLELITGIASVYQIDKSQLNCFSNDVKMIIHNHLEGQLNSGKLIAYLFAQLRSLDIEYYGGLEIKSIRDSGSEVLLETSNYNIITKQTIIATNAFTKQFYPEIAIIPQRNQILLTKPIADLSWQGNFHLDQGYFYFRNIGNRVLIGGGRHFSAEIEQTDEFGLTENVLGKLKEILSRILLPDRSFEVESVWSGILATSNDKNSIVKKVTDRIILAVRLGGMGIAISNLVADEAINLLVEYTDE